MVAVQTSALLLWKQLDPSLIEVQLWTFRRVRGVALGPAKQCVRQTEEDRGHIHVATLTEPSGGAAISDKALRGVCEQCL